ncbi:MAG: hypothetical protein WCG05_02075 [Alphaproteobacteria bacterium]
MKINKADLSSTLKKQGTTFKSLLFYGDQEGWVASEVENALRLNFPKTPIKRIYEEVLLQKKIFLSDLLSSNNLFGDNELILVTQATDKLCPLLKEVLSQDRDTLFIVQSSEYLGPSSKLRQLYEKESTLGSIPCYAPDVRTLSAAVKNYFASEQKIISDALAHQVAGLFLKDASLLSSELKKLCTYMGDKTHVLEEDIAKVLSPLVTEDTQRLVASFLAKDKKALQEECDLNKVSNPIGLIRELLNKLIRLHHAKALAGTHSADQLLFMVSPPVFFTEKAQFLNQLRLWNAQDLETTVLKLLALESQCKLNSQLSEDLFKNFCLKF